MKKRFIAEGIAAFVAVALIAAAVTTACVDGVAANPFLHELIRDNTGGDTSSSTFTVTFDKNGGDTEASPPTLTVASGGLVTAPAPPAKAGYTFGGWYKEAALTTAWNFAADTVTANITLYAKWETA